MSCLFLKRLRFPFPKKLAQVQLCTIRSKNTCAITAHIFTSVTSGPKSAQYVSEIWIYATRLYFALCLIFNPAWPLCLLFRWFDSQLLLRDCRVIAWFRDVVTVINHPRQKSLHADLQKKIKKKERKRESKKDTTISLFYRIWKGRWFSNEQLPVLFYVLAKRCQRPRVASHCVTGSLPEMACFILVETSKNMTSTIPLPWLE